MHEAASTLSAAAHSSAGQAVLRRDGGEQNRMAGETILPFIVEETIYEIDYEDGLPVVEDALGRLQRGEPLPNAPTHQRHAV